MLEPIPFAGMVETDIEIANLATIMVELYGKNPENMPKYVVLGDGSLYIFHKEEDRHALCNQTKTLQEGIPATPGTGGEASPQCSGTCSVCDGQKGSESEGQGY